MYSCTFSVTSVLDGGVGGLLPSPGPRKENRYPLYRTGLDWCGKSRPHRDSIPNLSVWADFYAIYASLLMIFFLMCAVFPDICPFHCLDCSVISSLQIFSSAVRHFSRRVLENKQGSKN